MRRLVLVRHAKAEVPSVGMSDHDRMLTPEGRTAASNLGRVLVAAGVSVDTVIVSTAMRAVQTWDLMKQAWPDAEVVTSAEVYETDVEGLMEHVNDLPDAVQTVMVVGHEPTASATAAFLAGNGSDTASLKRVAHGLPTGSAAVLETELSWADLSQRQAVLVKICASNVQF